MHTYIHTYMHACTPVLTYIAHAVWDPHSLDRSRSGINQFDIVALFSCPMRLREGCPFYRSGIARGMFGRGRNSVWRVCNHTYNVFQSQIRCRVNKVEHKQRTPINKGTQTQYLPSKQITSPTWPSNKRWLRQNCCSVWANTVAHDAHFAAPLAGQPAPAGGTPLLHVQTFAAK